MRIESLKEIKTKKKMKSGWNFRTKPQLHTHLVLNRRVLEDVYQLFISARIAANSRKKDVSSCFWYQDGHN